MFAALAISTETDYLNIYHTVLELACIFIAMSVFFSVWFTSRNSSSDNFILGFGYLSVAIFDAFHTLYFLKLNLTANTYFDLSTRFWILGRITEAYILYFFTQFQIVKANRWPTLVFTLISVMVVSYFAITFSDFIPVLLTDKGVTPIKAALEIIIIFVYVSTLCNINGKFSGQLKVANKYIFIAILLAIPSELCFTSYTSVSSAIWIIGHILKIVSYTFLFRGTFVSTVIFPYNMLEEENRKLNKAYEKLDLAHNDKASAIKTLNDIMDALPVAVLTYDSNNRLKFINRKFEEMLECDKYDLYGKTSDEIKAIFFKNKENLLNDTKNNNEQNIHNIVPYRTTSGKNIKLSVTSHDINNGILMLFSDAKKEQELENIHLQTQTIMNAVSNCILMIDRNKKIVLCNEALENVFEMERKDILNKDIDDLNKMLNFEAKDLPDLTLSGSNDKQIYEVSLTTLNGNKKDLRLYIAAIKNVYGEIIGGISIGTDITELKKEQLKMIQQEKLALLGQMGAGIVHETRNYLTTIKGRCQLIDILAPTGEIKKHTQKINSNIDEVNRIISEFLLLSKPRDPELIEVSMYDVLYSLKSMVETSSLVKGVNVDFLLSKEERYLLCDEAQIKQVILNICKNAVDAMSDTPDAKLRIETGFLEQNNEMYIKISDNGNGISKEDLNKIGTPFYTTKKTGTGLGLSVCHQILKLHNGYLKVESELSVGTTFTIHLPCLKDESTEEPA